MSTSDEDELAGGMFDEPEGFRQPEKACTYECYHLEDGRTLDLRLVGSNPLWGHLLWNGAKRLSRYLQEPHNSHSLITGKHILELGAGAGLPSLICALHNASKVVVTDYPDAELVDNLRHNIDSCQFLPSPANIVAEGYLWGADTSALSRHLPVAANGKFDTLLLADLLFNHSEHGKLVKTVRQLLTRTKDARALVFFTPYRPWLLQKDLAFFDLLAASNNASIEVHRGAADGVSTAQSAYGAVTGILSVHKLFEEISERAMFEEDPGDATLKRTVFGYEICWQDLQD